MNFGCTFRRFEQDAVIRPKRPQRTPPRNFEKSLDQALFDDFWFKTPQNENAGIGELWGAFGPFEVVDAPFRGRALAVNLRGTRIAAGRAGTALRETSHLRDHVTDPRTGITCESVSEEQSHDLATGPSAIRQISGYQRIGEMP